MTTKRIALLFFCLLACAGATTAFAQGKVGDVCYFEGTLVGIGQPLSCVDHVLQPAVRISISAKVLDDHQHLVTEFQVIGLNGQLTSRVDMHKHKKVTLTSANVTEGFGAIFRPHQLPSGDILLDYEVEVSRLLALPTGDVGDRLSIQQPSVNTLVSKGSIKLHSGQEASVPLGVGSGASQRSHYTIQLTASPTEG